MRNYQNGKIYTVRSRSRPDLVYVGSTIQPLSVRMGMHRQSSNGCTSKQIVDIGDAYIELIEEFPCENKEQLNKREGHFQRSMDCVNKIIAGRTVAEYREDNQESILAQKKQYYEDNQESILAQKKQYYEDNQEYIFAYQKQYNQDNHEFISARGKQYYEDNIMLLISITKLTRRRLQHEGNCIEKTTKRLFHYTRRNIMKITRKN